MHSNENSVRTRTYRLTRAIAFAAATALSATAVRAQATPPTTAPTAAATTRPAQTPVLAENTVLRADVPYGGIGDPLEVLDVYSPRGASGAPILIFIHGG